MEKKIRLDKFLSNQGIGSRSEVRTYIRRGYVSHNDNIIKDPSYKVLTDDQEIRYNNQPVYYVNYVYLMLNKPKNVVSATTDKKDKTVIDLINHPLKDKLFPVGRLDKDTTGLILLTDNGQLAHNLLSPKKHVDKTYIATIDGKINENIVARFQKGILIDDGYTTMPSVLKLIEENEAYSIVSITIKEGKFHQIKKMFENVEREVLELKRISMGSLVLDAKLQEGEFRPLTLEELAGLENEGNHV